MHDTTRRLTSLCPPPTWPAFARGSRTTALAETALPIPDELFDLIECYGDVEWLDWLAMPSLYAAHGRRLIRALTVEAQGVDADIAIVAAFNDANDVSVGISTDGTATVLTRSLVHRSEWRFTELLARWCAGEDVPGLPKPSHLCAGIAPFASPLWDPARGRSEWSIDVRASGLARQQRWESLMRSLGPHTLRSRSVSFNGHTNRAYVGALELSVSFESSAARTAVDRLRLRYYADRQAEIDAAIESALVATRFSVLRVVVHGNR